jgi:hypothetical protein
VVLENKGSCQAAAIPSTKSIASNPSTPFAPLALAVAHQLCLIVALVLCDEPACLALILPEVHKTRLAAVRAHTPAGQHTKQSTVGREVPQAQRPSECKLRVLALWHGRTATCQKVTAAGKVRLTHTGRVLVLSCMSQPKLLRRLVRAGHRL